VGERVAAAERRGEVLRGALAVEGQSTAGGVATAEPLLRVESWPPRYRLPTSVPQTRVVLKRTAARCLPCDVAVLGEGVPSRFGSCEQDWR